MKTRIVVGILAGIALACSGGAVLIGIAGSSTPSAEAPALIDEPTATKTKAPAAPKTNPAPSARISGDDVVQVGDDIPAGSYRATQPVDGFCYWQKSRDAEGANIIDNGTPTGGRPQVTLKKGQWFTSQGCPDWSKQK